MTSRSFTGYVLVGGAHAHSTRSGKFVVYIKKHPLGDSSLKPPQATTTQSIMSELYIVLRNATGPGVFVVVLSSHALTLFISLSLRFSSPSRHQNASFSLRTLSLFASLSRFSSLLRVSSSERVGAAISHARHDEGGGD